MVFDMLAVITLGKARVIDEFMVRMKQTIKL